MEIRIYQIHKKEFLVYNNIEDKYAINPKENLFAIADGASQKFQSGIWAELITQDFIRNPNFDTVKFKNRLILLVDKFENQDFKFSGNPAIEAIEKIKLTEGASSTFIGMKLTSNKIKFIACGDSNFFQFRNQKLINSFPYKNDIDLKNNNNFFNTVRLKNGEDSQHNITTETFEIQIGDKLILATDALSSLIFRKPEILEEISALKSFEQFNLFCETLWDNKELAEDDITAIIIEVSDKKKLKEIIPPKGFSFPPIVHQTINYVLNQNKDMQEIKSKLNQIDNRISDLIDLQRKKDKIAQKKYKQITVILIFSILLNLILLFQNSNRLTNKDLLPIEKKLDAFESVNNRSIPNIPINIQDKIAKINNQKFKP